VQKLNEAALSSVLADVTFIETEIKRLDKPDLDRVFDEIKLVRHSANSMSAGEADVARHSTLFCPTQCQPILSRRFGRAITLRSGRIA
jgi:hypothetical protein